MQKLNKKIFALIIAFAFVLEIFTVSFSSAAAASPIDKIVFVHNANNGGGKPSPQDTGSYKLMGVSWPTNKLPVQFEINPAFTNPDGSKVASSNVISAILLAANEWDDGTYSQSEGNTWAGVSTNLFADYSTSKVPTASVSTATSDGRNEIVWSNLGSQGTIAMTTVWYNRFTKQIVEFDMQFNAFYKWSTTGASDSMDIQNIATHELGHSIGLADLYKPNAKQETMYGYSSEGIISARVPILW